MRPWQRSATRAGYALYVLYAVYAIAGAVAQKMGTTLPVRLGDVGEFCLFFAATILFGAGLIQEDAETQSSGWLAALNENAERYAMHACEIEPEHLNGSEVRITSPGYTPRSQSAIISLM